MQNKESSNLELQSSNFANKHMDALSIFLLPLSPETFNLGVSSRTLMKMSLYILNNLCVASGLAF